MKMAQKIIGFLILIIFTVFFQNQKVKAQESYSMLDSIEIKIEGKYKLLGIQGKSPMMFNILPEVWFCKNGIMKYIYPLKDTIQLAFSIIQDTLLLAGEDESIKSPFSDLYEFKYFIFKNEKGVFLNLTSFDNNHTFILIRLPLP